jgi:hypothetical protein
LMQRVPFLLRAQVRLGARDLTADALGTLDDMDSLLRHTQELRPVISETSVLLVRLTEVMGQVRASSHEIAPLLAQASALLDDEQLKQTLSTADRLSERSLALLVGVERMQQSNEGALERVVEQVDVLVRRWILYLALAGSVCILLFWVGYYVVRRLGSAR